MSRQALDELKQQISLLDYLQVHDWQPTRQLSRGRWMGLCPLHADQKPSFLVDTSKGLFYCYGCGRGGDVIRFAELYHQVKFPQALALLRQWRGLPSLRSLKPAVYISRLMRLRCILEELAWTEQLPDLARLIRREDSPRPPQRLPRALTAQQDQSIQQELLRRSDLAANVFLLLRHTGMRIGECVDLSWDCLRNVAPDRWAIHVPLGKLKTERMVPVDSFVCELVQRLRFFRAFDPLPPDGHLLARTQAR